LGGPLSSGPSYPGGGERESLSSVAAENGKCDEEEVDGDGDRFNGRLHSGGLLASNVTRRDATRMAATPREVGARRRGGCGSRIWPGPGNAMRPNCSRL
jgi:hypothetical protein